jgi:F-type H+-transporting ATPase subunit alpha
LNLAQYREVESFAQFGSDLDPTTRDILERGSRLIEILKQVKYNPYPVEVEIPVLYVGRYGYLENIPVERIEKFEQGFIYNLFYSWNDLFNQICSRIRISDDFKGLFNEKVNGFRFDFLKLSQKFDDYVDMPALRG